MPVSSHLIYWLLARKQLSNVPLDQFLYEQWRQYQCQITQKNQCTMVQSYGIIQNSSQKDKYLLIEAQFKGLYPTSNIHISLLFQCQTQKILANCTHSFHKKHLNKKIFCVFHENQVFLLLVAETWMKPVQTRRGCPAKRVVDAVFPQCKAQRKNKSQLGKFSLCCGGGTAPPTIQRSWKTKQKQKLVEDILSPFCFSL